ncbi:MAG: hypothetical protein WDW38_010566 [Sanguina aurantia]
MELFYSLGSGSCSSRCEQTMRHLPAHIKNRRLAYMQRLQAGKEYFSDEAMQLRAPLLYQQQISQAGSGPAGPPGGGCPQQQESEPEEPPAGGRGTQLSDWLMRCAQKAEVTRLTKEQQAVEDAQMSEEEEEGSEAGDEVDQSGDMEETGSSPPAEAGGLQLSDRVVAGTEAVAVPGVPSEPASSAHSGANQGRQSGFTTSAPASSAPVNPQVGSVSDRRASEEAPDAGAEVLSRAATLPATVLQARIRTHSSLQSSCQQQARLSACWDGKELQQQPLQPLDLGARPSDGSARKGSSRSWRGASTSICMIAADPDADQPLPLAEQHISHQLSDHCVAAAGALAPCEVAGASHTSTTRTPDAVSQPVPRPGSEVIPGGGAKAAAPPVFPVGVTLRPLGPTDMPCDTHGGSEGQAILPAPLPKMSLCHLKVEAQVMQDTALSSMQAVTLLLQREGPRAALVVKQRHLRQQILNIDQDHRLRARLPSNFYHISTSQRCSKRTPSCAARHKFRDSLSHPPCLGLPQATAANTRHGMKQAGEAGLRALLPTPTSTPHPQQRTVNGCRGWVSPPPKVASLLPLATSAKGSPIVKDPITAAVMPPAPTPSQLPCHPSQPSTHTPAPSFPPSQLWSGSSHRTGLQAQSVQATRPRVGSPALSTCTQAVSQQHAHLQQHRSTAAGPGLSVGGEACRRTAMLVSGLVPGRRDLSCLYKELRDRGLEGGGLPDASGADAGLVSEQQGTLLSMLVGHRISQARAASLGQGMLQWHQDAVAEAQRRREAAGLARISALKSSDMTAYMGLVRETKNQRLQAMMEQTDACLRSFSSKLGLDKLLARHTPAAGAAPADHAGAAAGGGSRGPPSGGEVDSLLASGVEWGRLSSCLQADIPAQPATCLATLRDYQMHGLRWLVGLHDARLNGILADDMGLGKTVQVAGKRFNVLLTSYEFMMGKADRPRLCRLHYKAIVVDEGHRLKNAECKLAAEMRLYKSDTRLLLTGTPLQNKLDELWALLNFLMPGIFGDADDFKTWFTAPLR